MGSHAKMKPVRKKPQAIKELEQATLLNEVALALGVKMLMQLHPNDAEFGKAVRNGITNGMDLKAIQSELEHNKTEIDPSLSKSNINQDENPQTK